MIEERFQKRRGRISSWAIERPIGTLMLTSVVIVLGLVFLSRLPLDMLPQINYPQVRASVNYGAVEPQVLEETVAKPLERALATTENLIRMETEIQEGRVAVNLHFRYGTDVDFALQDASKNLDRARASLPIDVSPPTIFKFDPSQLPVYEVAFSSPTRDLVALRTFVEERLAPQLLTIEGVASTDVSGGLIREIQVVLDQERLRSYGFTVSQVIDALRQANMDVAAGRVSSNEWEVIGKTSGKFQSVNDIRAVVLTAADGRRIPLTEVATVTDTHQQQRLWARLNGVPAVKLSVRKQPDANTVRVADEVDAGLNRMLVGGFVPEDIHFEVIANQAGFIRNSVGSVRNAALAGGMLAMIMVLVFLRSLRKTLVVGLAIPFALLTTFLLMGVFGLTLNLMSLGGLALGVGLLIDNSIVMLENIFRKRDEGIGDPVEAAHEGAGQVQGAVVASTATNLAAVVPFLLISGLAALLFRELILTISFAIIGSLLVALTLVPMMSAQLAKVRFSSGLGNARPLLAFDSGLDRLRGHYRRAAGRAVQRPGLVVVSAIVLCVVSVSLARGLENEFLPQVDDGNVSVFVGLPPGQPPEQTNRVALEIERMIGEMPHVKHVFTTAGGMLFGSSTSQRAGRGSIAVQLAPISERKMSAGAWVNQLQQRIDERGFAGARVGVRPPRLRGIRTSSSGADVAISVQGEDLGDLQRVALEIQRTIRGVPGLGRVDASADEGSPQLSIQLDRERSSFLGLNAAAVGQTVRTALDGTIATRFTEGAREFDVRVMMPRENFTSPEDLASVALFPGQRGGAPIYLRDVATVSRTVGPTDIMRQNQLRTVRVTADVLEEVAPLSVVNDSIRARLASLALPENTNIVYGGEEEAIRESNRQLIIVVSLAVFLVFVVLAVQYERLVNPFVILLTIPLSLIGVGIALRLTGMGMSAPVMLGIILLAGIVVNNAILLVEYVEQFRHDHGVPMREAVVEAGAVRLRPILMTTATTALGMLPLALGIGEGSEMMQPLAVAVVGGLAFSTLLTLFVVPAAYVLMNGAADRLSTFVTGRGAAPVRTPEPAAGD